MNFVKEGKETNKKDMYCMVFFIVRTQHAWLKYVIV